MKPKLKPPGTKCLKLEYDGLLSNFGFKFNLRRYTVAVSARAERWLFEAKARGDVVPSSSNSSSSGSSGSSSGSSCGAGVGGWVWAGDGGPHSKVGPARYCLPCHRMPYNKKTRVNNALSDVAGNRCQALEQGWQRAGPASRGWAHH